MEQKYEKQGYLLEDFRLFHLRSAGVRTEYHYHEFCKLLLLVSGSGGYWVEGQHYALQPGDIVLVDSQRIHRPEFEETGPYERIIIYISPEFLRQRSTEDCLLTECFAGTPVLRSERNRLLLSIVQQMEAELSGQEPGREILGNGLLMRLLVEIFRERRSGRPLPVGQLPDADSRVREIVAYIDENLTEELTVQSIADRFYLSKFHMMRLFRAGTGSSVASYITNKRLLLARELIEAGYSATESCFRAGFGSYSSFTRACGKYFGVTPTGRQHIAPMRDAGDE